LPLCGAFWVLLKQRTADMPLNATQHAQTKQISAEMPLSGVCGGRSKHLTAEIPLNANQHAHTKQITAELPLFVATPFHRYHYCTYT
jgi:hypothetical protein